MVKQKRTLVVLSDEEEDIQIRVTRKTRRVVVSSDDEDVAVNTTQRTHLPRRAASTAAKRISRQSQKRDVPDDSDSGTESDTPSQPIPEQQPRKKVARRDQYDDSHILEAAAQSWVDLCARLSARFKRQALRPLQLKYLLKIEAAWKHMKSTGVYKPIVLIAPTGFGKSFIMGALNFVAVPDGPVLHLCHWQVLNHSNASFFLDREKLSDFFEERRDQGNLGREVHINTAKETKGSCYGGLKYSGVLMAKNRRKELQMDFIRRLVVDEFPHSTLVKGSSDMILGDKFCPGAREKLLLQAFPTYDILDIRKFHVIEIPYLQCVRDGYLKDSSIVVVPETDMPAGERHAAYNGGKVFKAIMQAMRSAMKVADDAAAKRWVALGRELVEKVRADGADEKWQKRLDYWQQNPFERSPQLHAGTFIRVNGMGQAKECLKNLKREFGDGFARVIHSEMDKDDIAAALDDYATGRVKALIVINMLRVGFHNPRTAVVVPLDDGVSPLMTLSFMDALQLYGRAGSTDRFNCPQTHRYLVAGASFLERLRFIERYQTYARDGCLRLRSEDPHAFPNGRANDDDDDEHKERGVKDGEETDVEWTLTTIEWNGEALDELPVDIIHVDTDVVESETQVTTEGGREPQSSQNADTDGESERNDDDEPQSPPNAAADGESESESDEDESEYTYQAADKKTYPPPATYFTKKTKEMRRLKGVLYKARDSGTVPQILKIARSPQSNTLTDIVMTVRAALGDLVPFTPSWLCYVILHNDLYFDAFRSQKFITTLGGLLSNLGDRGQVTRVSKGVWCFGKDKTGVGKNKSNKQAGSSGSKVKSGEMWPLDRVLGLPEYVEARDILANMSQSRRKKYKARLQKHGIPNRILYRKDLAQEEVYMDTIDMHVYAQALQLKKARSCWPNVECALRLPKRNDAGNWFNQLYINYRGLHSLDFTSGRFA